MVISTAHDYIMRRSSIPMSYESRETRKSWVEQISVSAATLKMIQYSLQDATLGYTDATVVAVLHLTYAGLIGCNADLIHIHCTALHTIIVKRGGLRSANFQHPIPGIIAITILLIATTWDISPLPIIQEFTASQRTTPSPDSRTKVPESPVYCRPGGYMTLCEVVPRESPTYQLLDALRQLTVAFDARHAQIGAWPFHCEDQVKVGDDQCLTRFNMLRDRVLSHRRVDNLRFSSIHDRNVYEALHLTAQIFVEALANGVTFSQAASCLETEANGQINRSVAPRIATDDTVPRRPAVHVQIRDALLRTNMMDCWDHMGGVLLWIAIVASAAGRDCGLASGASRRIHLTGEQLQEEELARQYLAAVAVRADILQHFEYQTAIMGMLKNLARIQGLLRRSRDQTRARGIASLVDRSRESTQRMSTPQPVMVASAGTLLCLDLASLTGTRAQIVENVLHRQSECLPLRRILSCLVPDVTAATGQYPCPHRSCHVREVSSAPIRYFSVLA
nr:hypothetical protein CFP56_00841 [Quercus suber]